MSKLLKFVKRIEPEKGTFAHTLYDGFFTLLYTPDEVTHGGTHIKDGIDLKRTMVIVVLAMQLAYIFGCYNIGHQHFIAIGEHTGFLDGFHLKLFFGLGKLLPIFIVTHVVGLAIEFYYAYKKGHGIEEGFLVTGALIPLIMPPDLPLWMLALAVGFAVWIGKEAFGGTGMNIWNVALLARVFVFFSYPTSISGDEVWVSGLIQAQPGSGVEYGLWHDICNSIFGLFDASTFDETATVIDGFSGATPLILAYQGGWEAVTQVYSESQMWWGAIPGSIGETSKPLIILGAIFLLITGIASWRIMFSMLIGAALMSMVLNAWDATPFMSVPWYFQFYIGSFFFAMAFMATDPVTAAATSKGKWIYGFMIGALGIIVRVLNPAYPEGWMLAILLMNTFAPLIDHYVIQANISKRLKRA